jgi:hypothetical protein
MIALLAVAGGVVAIGSMSGTAFTDARTAEPPKPPSILRGGSGGSFVSAPQP